MKIIIISPISSPELALIEVLVEETRTKEKMRTKNDLTGERKTILAKDDEETLSSKHLHGALKQPR